MRDRTRALTQGLLLVTAFAAAGCDTGTVSPAAVLAQGQKGITAIATDGSFVYWSMVDGSVKRVSIDGGEPETIVSSKLGPTAEPNLAVDAAHVYWTNGGAVMAAPKDGGAIAVLAGDKEPLSDLTGLAVEDATDFVYFTESAGLVRKAPKVAGEIVTLASGESHPASPVASGASLFWGTAVANSDAQASAVRAIDINGGTSASTLVQSPGFAKFSVDASNVYAGSGGVVRWASLAGGDVIEVDSGETELAAVVGDTAYVYWSSVAGNVGVVPVLPGASSQSLISGPPGKISIAVDATSLYWSNPTDGVVMVMPKL